MSILVVMVMLLMVVAAAVSILVVMVMLLMVVAAAVSILVVMVMLLMVMTAAAMAVLVMVVMMRVSQFLQLLGHSGLALHSRNKLFTAQFVPRRSDEGCLAVMLPKQGHSGIQLSLRNGIGTGENDGGSCFDLVIIELTKILHIHLDLACIGHSYGIAQHYIVRSHLLHGGNNIRQLAHTGRLDDDPVRSKFRQNLLQSLTKIAHQAAADTTGVHFRNVDTRILQKAAVNANLTKLIFNQHQLLAPVAFLNHLLNQRRLTCAEEAGINVDLCHIRITPLCSIVQSLLFYHVITIFAIFFPSQNPAQQGSHIQTFGVLSRVIASHIQLSPHLYSS